MNWISYIKNDEDRALRDIYTTHRSACISWLKSSYTLTEEDAKEVFQDSVIILYDNIMTPQTSGIDFWY